MITTMSRVAGSLLILRQTSNPDIFGIITSSRTRSGFSRWIASIASIAEARAT